MALITITGYPCSGKSHTADLISTHFTTLLSSPSYSGPSYTLHIITDIAPTSLNPDWRSSYDSSQEEKPARASLFARVTRELGEGRIVIVDSANYIKGFRYQMYCAGREAGVRVATVFAAAPPDVCEERHSLRPPSEQYKPETFANLIQRYEEPSSMVRWDSPLFTFNSTSPAPLSTNPPSSDLSIQTLPDSESQIDPTTTLLNSLFQSITIGEKQAPPSSVIPTPTTPSNSLQILTKSTTSILNSITSSLSIYPPGSSAPVQIVLTPSFSTTPTATTSKKMTLRLPPGRIPTLSELQRLKRQFEGMKKKVLTSGGKNSDAGEGWTEQGVGEAFVGFLMAGWGV